MPKARWPGFPRLRELVARRRDPVMILPYLGYGTSEKLALCGRVLQDEGFRPAQELGAPLAQPGCIREAPGER